MTDAFLNSLVRTRAEREGLTVQYAERYPDRDAFRVVLRDEPVDVSFVFEVSGRALLTGQYDRATFARFIDFQIRYARRHIDRVVLGDDADRSEP